MFPLPLVTSSTCVDTNKFWKSVLLYIERPHLVNRKLVAALPHLIYEVKTDCPSLHNVFTKSALLYETRKLKTLTKSEINVEFLRNMFESHDRNVQFTVRDFSFISNSFDGIFLVVQTLLPKNSFYTQNLEVSILNRSENTVTIINVSELGMQIAAPPFPYDLKLSQTSNFQIIVNNIEDADSSHAEWLADKLFNKLLKWMDQEELENSVKSLSLISTEDYYSTYINLKSKYGEKLVKEWPKVACTNPEKYVYEDIAIASYLICIWKRFDNERSIKFVDCGCGNGLLVYILSEEGYNGFGWDLRKRKVWDIYPKTTQLHEQVVTSTSTFPDCNWLIGNHSDELTPWIPIICLNSSIEMNYFVLPCCPFDLDGRKYIRKNTSVSQYADYMDYIKELSIKCGFHTEIDKLRISSTKRTCLVGIRRNKDVELYEKIKTNTEKMCIHIKPKIRDKKEKVRNCTQLNRNLKDRIVLNCVNCILEVNNFILKSNGEQWNKGKPIHLSELSKQLPVNDLKELKSECGGLQTLLKNHRYIFELQNGCVGLREPYKLIDTLKYCEKPCWFMKNHPNGCLFPSAVCAYKHDE